MDNKLTHFDNSGNARMVDVGSKVPTERVAIAVSRIKVSTTNIDNPLNIKFIIPAEVLRRLKQLNISGYFFVR